MPGSYSTLHKTPGTSVRGAFHGGWEESTSAAIDYKTQVPSANETGIHDSVTTVLLI